MYVVKSSMPSCSSCVTTGSSSSPTVRAASMALSRAAAYACLFLPYLVPSRLRRSLTWKRPPGGLGSWLRLTRCVGDVVQLLHGERGTNEGRYPAVPRGCAPLGEPRRIAIPAGP